MGTRADWWVKRENEPLAASDWIGSIAWDGYPEGVENKDVGVPGILSLTDESAFREAVNKLSRRDDFTDPKTGWPWPWDDSRTTDYAYVFAGGVVRVYCFGRVGKDASPDAPKVDIFPDMKAVQNVAHGPRSGFIVLSTRRNA